jgi:hypothetical protein
MVPIKILFVVRFKHLGFRSSAYVNHMLSDLVHAMPCQYMFALSLSLSLSVYYNRYENLS